MDEKRREFVARIENDVETIILLLNRVQKKLVESEFKNGPWSTSFVAVDWNGVRGVLYFIPEKQSNGDEAKP
jgi:hypothetical protein